MSKNELTANTNQSYMNLANFNINGDFLEELSGLDNQVRKDKNTRRRWRYVLIAKQ